MPFLADRRAFKHLPVVGRGGCWLRYVGQSFGGVVSELIGERDGWSRPRLFRQILTRQIWGSAQQLSIRNQSYCATLLLPKTWTGVNFRLCFYLNHVLTMNVFLHVPVDSCSNSSKTGGEVGRWGILALALVLTVQAVHAEQRKMQSSKVKHKMNGNNCMCKLMQSRYTDFYSLIHKT